MNSHGMATTESTLWASCSRTPQLIAGARSPMPRKLSAVSARIMLGTASVAAAMMWLMNDGSMWRKITPRAATPSRTAEVMKSSSRRERNLPRTTRAISGQPSSDRIREMKKNTFTTGQRNGSAALSPIHSGRVGMEVSTSMKRWITRSTAPPK